MPAVGQMVARPADAVCHVPACVLCQTIGHHYWMTVCSNLPGSSLSPPARDAFQVLQPIGLRPRTLGGGIPGLALPAPRHPICCITCWLHLQSTSWQGSPPIPPWPPPWDEHHLLARKSCLLSNVSKSRYCLQLSVLVILPLLTSTPPSHTGKMPPQWSTRPSMT